MNATVIICTSENFHPYECRDEGNPGAVCRHCAGIKDNEHDPDMCALCHWDDEKRWTVQHLEERR